MLSAGSFAIIINKKVTAKDYIQDNLITMWDGIENAGWGVHDSNATVWKDLVGNNSSTNMILYGGSEWSSNSLYLDRNKSSYTTTDHLNNWTDINTLEVVFRIYEVYSIQPIIQLSDNENNLAMIIRGYDRITGFHNSGFYRQTPHLSFTKINTITKSKGNMGWYHNGVDVGGDNYDWDPSYATGRTTIGTRGNLSQFFSGFIFCCRLYSRKLITEEITYNYMVDQLRFN